jgi:hypothetical protein
MREGQAISVETMLFHTINAVRQLSEDVGALTEATGQLVEVTKALHRERAAQIKQEVEELDPDNHPKLNNFKLFHLHARLAALEMPARTPEQIKASGQMAPYMKPNGAG